MKTWFAMGLLLLSAGNLQSDPGKKYPASMIREFGDEGTGFTQGRLYLSGGYGLINGNFIAANALKKSVGKNWENISLNKRPTWMVRAEYALTPHWGLGLNFATGGLGVHASLDSFISPDVRISGDLKYSTWSLLTRVNYHILADNKFDLYVGLGIGYRGNKVTVTSNDNITDRWNFPVDLGFIEKRIPNTLRIPFVGADFTVGFRYHVLPALAVYAEAGVAKSVLQTGITLGF